MIAPSVLADYTNDIAFVAETQPATTPGEFAEQLETAAKHLNRAGINGADDLNTAAAYLADATRSKGAKRSVLLKQALGYLVNVRDMADEYRLMA